MNSAVRDVEAGQACVGLEYVFAHSGQLAVFTDLHIGQLRAVVESIAIDLCNRVRNGDSGQAAVTESTPADALQFAAFLEGHGFQSATPEEVELADIGDVLTNDNLLDLILVCFPRSLVCVVIRHGTVPGDIQNTLRV